jgi:ribose 5-phosphate isomerase B
VAVEGPSKGNGCFGCGTLLVMRVHLGSDHAGFELKGALIARLGHLGHQAVDHGPVSYVSDDDYPPYVMAAAAATAADPQALGIVIGGSGNGEAIAANKVPGVRCALAWSDETAQLGRLHNNANVLSLGARQYSIEDAVHFAEVFLATAFSAEPRHERRIAMLTDYERSGQLPSVSAGG